ncbi:MAG: Fic/DOC family protein [Christensenellales bacterium]|jgi:cell filamentation protein
MSNFFDKYELYTEGDSIYLYEGTHVLKNKFDIKDYETLKKIESDIVFAALLELELNPIKGKFDKKHLYDIHRFLFQEIYDFAGQTRKEDISKGNTKFCVHTYIDEQLDELFNKVRAVDFKSLNDKEKAIDHLAYLMAELNIIHPFRDGNGRAIREFIRELAEQLGYKADWNRVDKENLMDAMIKSVFDTTELKRLFNVILSKI